MRTPVALRFATGNPYRRRSVRHTALLEFTARFIKLAEKMIGDKQIVELYGIVKEIANDRDEIKRLIFDEKNIKFKRIDILWANDSAESVNEQIISTQALLLTDFRTCLAESNNVDTVGWQLIIILCICIEYSQFDLNKEIILSIADAINILSQSGSSKDLADSFHMQITINKLLKHNQIDKARWQPYGIEPTDIINIKRAQVFIALMLNAMVKPPLFIMSGRKLLLKTDDFVGTGLYDYIISHNKKTAEKDLQLFKKVGAEDIYDEIMCLYSLSKSKLKKAASDESIAICNKLKDVTINYISFNYAQYLQN